MKREDITIEEARYGGIYSGGDIHAWGCPETEIPWEAYGDDVSCCEYWCGDKKEPVGVGQTEESAIFDLHRKIENKGTGDRPYE